MEDIVVNIVVVSLSVLIPRITIQYEDREECMFDSSFFILLDL